MMTYFHLISYNIHDYKAQKMKERLIKQTQFSLAI